MTRLNIIFGGLLFVALSACNAAEDHGHAHGPDGHGTEAHETGGHAHGEDGSQEDHDDHDSEAAHGHGGGVVVTDFTDTTELFVEFPPFAVGRESAFAAHFTRLDDFTPVDSGEVIVRLSGGGVAEEVFRGGPTPTAGIFRPAATPRNAARRRVSVELISGDVRALHDLGEYQVFRSAAEADASLAHEDEDTALVPFLKEQQWKVDFATAPVTQDTLSYTVTAPGTLSVSPNANARVTAIAEGVLKAPEGGFPDLGSAVKRGEVLGRIQPRLGGDLDRRTLDAERDSALAAFEAVKAERERIETLYNEGAVPERRLIEVQATERQAELRLRAARERGDAAGGASGVKLRAPIDGRIQEITTSDGIFVNAGDPLFHIIDDERLRLTARIAEVDMADVGMPQSAVFTVPGNQRLYDLNRLEGRLISAQTAVDSVSRTAPIIFEFNNMDSTLRPGASVLAGVRTAQTFTGPVIPASALVDEAGQNIVYVMVDGENWERRVVRIALRDGERVGIASGLEPGERIVARGAYLVRLAASGPAEAGHGHAH